MGNESFFSAPQLKRHPLGGASRRDRGYRNVERRSLVPRPDIQEPPFRSGTRTAWNRNRLAVRGFAFSLPRLQRPLSPRSWSQLRRDWVSPPSPRLSEHGGPWRCTCRALLPLGRRWPGALLLGFITAVPCWFLVSLLLEPEPLVERVHSSLVLGAAFGPPLGFYGWYLWRRSERGQVW